MFFVDNVYKSLMYSVRAVVPSGVSVVDGEAIGINTENPAFSPPSVTVTLEEQSTAAIELGSTGTKFDIIFTIDAQSRRQRDAIKSILYAHVTTSQLPVYENFGANDFTPASGTVVQYIGEYGDSVIVRDMPDLNQGRERFFWTAAVFADLLFTGVR